MKRSTEDRSAGEANAVAVAQAPIDGGGRLLAAVMSDGNTVTAPSFRGNAEPAAGFLEREDAARDRAMRSMRSLSVDRVVR